MTTLPPGLSIGDEITVTELRGGKEHTKMDLYDETKPQVFRIMGVDANGSIELKPVFRRHAAMPSATPTDQPRSE